MPSNYCAAKFYPHSLRRIRHIELEIKFSGVYCKRTICEYGSEQREQIIYLMQILVCAPDSDSHTSQKTLRLIHRPNHIEDLPHPRSITMHQLRAYIKQKISIIESLSAHGRAVEVTQSLKLDNRGKP